MTAVEPWIALALLAIVVFPHALWLFEGRAQVIDGFNDSVPGGRLSAGLWLCAGAAGGPCRSGAAGGLASGWPRRRGDRAPEIVRSPVETLRALLCSVLRADAGACRRRLCLRHRQARAVRCAGAAGAAVGPRGLGRRRRYRDALPRAAGVERLARSAARAAGAGCGRHPCAAVDRAGRSQGRAAGGGDGVVLRREFPAPHRHSRWPLSRATSGWRRWSR